MKNTDSRKKRSLSQILFAALLLSLAAFVSYWTIYKDIDYEVCISQAARKMNIEPNYSSLSMHIEDLLHVGMSRSVVHETLQGIAPIQIRQINNSADPLERITMEICHHPLNNPILYAYYTYSGTLTSIRFEDGP